MHSCSAYAAMERGAPLTPLTIQRRAPLEGDVVVRILYCGVCHSDVFAVRKGRGGGQYPLVPGHEIVGEVVAVGSGVARFAPGDTVVVGTIIDSCRHCEPCIGREEQYCYEGVTSTYNGRDRHDGTVTKGGYASEIVVDERFVYHAPQGLDLPRVAPLLCAGATTFSPLRNWNVGPGKTVGIIGLGGLGHIALKLARAMGAHVVQFTTSPGKAEDAIEMGAHDVVLSRDPAAMAAQLWRFDFILDTVAGRHPLTPYMHALKLGGTICSLGLPAEGFDFEPRGLSRGRRSLTSSGVAGTAQTQAMLDFCAAHGIAADIELIGLDRINEAFDRLDRNDVRYRFVLDMRTIV